VQRTPTAAKAEFEAGIVVPMAARSAPYIIELLDIAEFTHHVDSIVSVGEPIFQPYPPEVAFQEYEPFETYSMTITFRNNDSVPRRMKVLPLSSRFFSVEALAVAGGTGRVAAGMELSYKVTFRPESKDDYECDMICVTEREKFVVKVCATGTNACLDCPDVVDFSVVPVRHATEKTFLVRNIGTKPVHFTTKISTPFSVTPSDCYLAVGSHVQLCCTFDPDRCGTYEGDLYVKYDKNKDFFVKLVGEASDVDVFLETQHLKMETTFTSLSSQKYVKLTNRSDITAHFEWKMFETSAEEEEHRLTNTVSIAQAEAMEERQWATSEDDRFGLELDMEDEIEGLGPKALSVGRKYKQLRKSIAEDRFLFQHPIFKVEPSSGEVWPNSSVELIVTFSPEVVGEFEMPAYLQVSGREDRLPLHLQATGVGPKVTISYDKLEIGNVFIGSLNEYEVVLMNDGRIPAEWHVEPNESTFGKMFSLSPSSGTLNVNEQTSVTVTFQSDKLGDFSESFVFHLDGCTDFPTVNFCGTVVGPIYEFDVTRIDYKWVSYGFLNGRTLLLSNTCDIPMKYHLYVPEDSDNEFSIVPSDGEIMPHGKQQVQLDFVAAHGSKKYECTLVADVEGPAGDVVGTVKVPLVGESTIPTISLSEETVDFGDCWNRYSYQRTFELINDTDLPTRYEVMPQSDASTALAIYSAEPAQGVVPARGRAELTINLATERLGKMNLPVFVQVVGLTGTPWLCNILVNALGPAVEFDQDNINWGKLPALKQDSKELKITNVCLIKAPFQCFIKGKNSAWEVDVRAGVIEPGESLTLNLSVYLDDTVRFTDELHVLIEEGKQFVIPLRAVGIGTTVYCEQSMKTIDFGNQFTSQTSTKVMTLENRGRRALTLTWVNQTTLNNEMMLQSKIKAAEKEDSKKKVKIPDPIPELFTVLPNKIIMEPMSSYDFVFSSFSKQPDPKASEMLVCTSVVTKSKQKPKPRPVFETEVKAVFADPLLEFSSPELKFHYSYVHGEQTPDIQTQPVSMKNVSKLPLSFFFRTQMPFTIDQAEEVISLEPGDSLTVNVQFDPGYQVDRLSVELNYPIVIRYEEHPQVDELPIIADIHFPNLMFETSEVTFGCVLNDSVKRVLVNVTNNSTIEVDYSWAFLEEDERKGGLPVNQTFDILPIRGIIKAGETQQVELVYYGHPKRRAKATAVCEVVGGPDYELFLKGEASEIQYELDPKLGVPYLVEFAPQLYTKIDEKDFLLFNTGKVDFDFSFSVDELTRANLVNMLPMSGRIPAGEKQKVTVKMTPQAPEHIHEYVALQVAHFEPVYIIIKGEGIYPKVMLTLPRVPDDVFEHYRDDARRQASSAFQDMNATGRSKALSTAGSVKSQLRPPSPGGGSEAGSKAPTRVSMTVKFPTKSAMAQSLEAEAERMCLVQAITEFAADSQKRIELPLDDSKSMAESRRLDGTMKRLTTLIGDNQPNCANYILDFGNIILGQSRKRQFNVSNIGFPAVSFDLDKRACNAAGFQVEPDKVGKLPGLPEPEGIDMTVIFQTHPKYTALGIVELDCPLDIRNGPPVSVLMRANVTVPDIELTAETLDFGRLLCGHRKTICIQLSNPGCVPAEWQVRKPIQGAGDWDFFKAEPESGVIQPSDRVNVQISFTPPDARPYRIKLPFKVQNNNMNTRSCLLKGVGVDLGVQFDPPMVEMGPVLPHADPISREIVMTNTSEAPLEIYSTDFDKRYLEEEEILRQCERFGFKYVEEKLFLSADTPEGRPRPPGIDLPDEMLKPWEEEKAAEAAKLAEEERQRAIEAGEIDPEAEEEGEGEAEAEPEAPPFEPNNSVNVIVHGAPNVGTEKICQLLSSRYRSPVIELDTAVATAMANDASEVGAQLREAKAALDAEAEEGAEPPAFVPSEELLKAALAELMESSADYDEGVIINGLGSEYVPDALTAAQLIFDAFKSVNRQVRVLVANADLKTLAHRAAAAKAAASDEPIPEEAPIEEGFEETVAAFNEQLPALTEQIVPTPEPDEDAEPAPELEEGEEPPPPPPPPVYLRVTVSHCTAHLPLAPGAGEPDPYVKLTLGETSVQTDAVPKDRSAPRWSQTLDLELDLSKPTALELQIMNRDADAEDVTMAAGTVDVRELIPGWMDTEAEDGTGALQSLRTTGQIDTTDLLQKEGKDGLIAQLLTPDGETTVPLVVMVEFMPAPPPLIFEIDAAGDLSTDVYTAICEKLPEPAEIIVEDENPVLQPLPTTTSLLVRRPVVRLPRDVVQHHRIYTKLVKPPEPPPEPEDGEEVAAPDEGEAEGEAEPEAEPEIEYVFEELSRWKLQPGESVTLKVDFTSDAVGVFDELMAFEIVGGTRPVSMLCRSTCAMPKLSTDFRNVYYKKTKAVEEDAACHQYVISRGTFEFGPLLANKFIGKDNIDVHSDKFRITNSGLFDLHVDFGFEKGMPALQEGDEGYDPSADPPLPVFLCDPPSMDLAIDETQDVTVWAFPSGEAGGTGTVSDKLVATIQDNPTPLVIPVSCIGARPTAEVNVEEVEFVRMLSDKQETKMIKVKNTGKIPFDFNVMDSWKAPHPRDRPAPAEGEEVPAPADGEEDTGGLGDEFQIYPLSGTVEPGTEAVISVEFASREPAEEDQAKIFDHDLKIEIFDAEKFLGIEQTLSVKIKAEAYKVLMDADYHDQPEDQPAGEEQHNFGLVKVGEPEKRTMTLKNTGKYECGFRFVLRKGMDSMFTITPQEATLQPEETKDIEFVFLTDREVTLEDNSDIMMHIFEPMTQEVTAKAAVAVSARAVFSKYKILPGAGVNFGPIIYGTDKTRSIEISNAGEFAHDYKILGTPMVPRSSPTPVPGGEEGEETPAEPASEEPGVAELKIGNFLLSPASGTIEPGETVRVEIQFSPGGSDIFGPGQSAKTFTEDVFVDIKHRDYDDNPTGIPFELAGESCMPSINTDDYNQVFEEQEVLGQLDPFGANKNVFGVQERAFSFGALVLGKEEGRQRFKISNTNKIPCNVSLSITPRLEKEGAEKFAFEVQPASMTIPTHEYRFAEVYFRPDGIQPFAGMLTAEVESGKKQLEFELRGEGNLPSITVEEPTTMDEAGAPLLAFPRVLVGKTRTLQVVLRNNGQVAAEVVYDLPLDPAFEVINTSGRGLEFEMPPKDRVTLQVNFAPTDVGDFKKKLTVSVLGNAFEKRSFSLVGEAYTEDVIFEGLPEDADDKLGLGDCPVGVEKQVSFQLNNRAAEARRFEFNLEGVENAENFSFSPAVGHIRGHDSKAIMLTFKPDAPVKLEALEITCALDGIQYTNEPPAEWDDRMRSVKFVDEEPPEDAGEDYVPKQQRVEEADPEPEHEIIEETHADKVLKIDVVADYGRLECDTSEIQFKSTMMYQTRRHHYTMKNAGLASMDYKWVMCNPDGSSPYGGSYFSVAPDAGTLAAGQEVEIVVAFQPMEVDQCHMVLRCDIPNMEEGHEPHVVAVSASSLRPMCHFELPESDYITSGRRSDDLKGPHGAVGSLDVDTKVIEFESLGTRVRNTNRFMVLNPTNFSYEFHWECADAQTVGSPFRCVNTSGLVLSGKKFEMVFEFTPENQEPRTQESHWVFCIPEYKVRAPFVLAGTISEPRVALSVPHINFNSMLLKGKATKTVQILNSEHIPFSFHFDTSALETGGGMPPISLEPSSGTVGGNSSIEVEVTFCPHTEKVYNFNLPCVVRTKPTPINLNIKGEGYSVHDVLMLEGEDGTMMDLSTMVPNIVEFGQVDINEKRIRPVVIVNSGRYNVDFSWAYSLSRKDLRITPDMGTVKPGARETCQLEFSPLQEVQLENFQAICSIANGSQYVLALNGTGRKPLLNFSFSFLDFGPTFLHRSGLEPRKAVLKITNDDTYDISFDCFYESTQQLDVQVSPTVLEPRESKEVPVTFYPRAVQSYEEKLEFEINGSYTHTVVIKGEGQEPRIELANAAHSSIAFGALRVGQEAFRSVKVVNRTGVEATIDLSRSFAKMEGCAISYTPNQEIVLKPKESTTLDIRFNPQQRIRAFNQELFIDVGGLTKQLLVVSGQGVGIDVKLESSTLIFGDVVLNSSVTKQLMIGNVGDIGTRFSWDPDQFAPRHIRGANFSIFPTEGFIPQNDEVKLEITFSPTALNDDIRLEGLRCNVEGAEPIDLTLTGKSVEAPDTNEVLEFSCPVRCPTLQTKDVTLQNPTDVSWSLKPSISHEAWHGAEMLNIPAGSSASYTLEYKPLTMTREEDAPHQGYIFFPLPDGSAVTYGLKGQASEPEPLSDTISIDVAAKEPHTQSLSVTNWLKTTQRFSVTIDRPDEPSTFVTYNANLDVSGMQTKEYKMTFNAFKEGSTDVKVTFTNLKTDEYVFYNLRYNVAASVVLQSIPLETRVRTPIAHTLSIENPLDATVTLTSTCESATVGVPEEVTIAPHSDASIAINYNPLLEEETDARLQFSCEELGDFPYTLNLKALPAGLEKPDLHFKTPLGSSQTQTFRFHSYLRDSGTEFKCEISDTANFEVEPTVKAEAAEDENGVEVSVELVFSPSEVGEFPCDLTVKSDAGGVYRVAMYGHSIAPQPQGPYILQSGGSAKIEFQNVFDSQMQFNFLTDNPAFTCKPGETIAAKKKVTIDVAYKPVPPEDGDTLEPVTHASLYVQIVDKKLSAWRYYLEGHNEEE
jgi:hydrocephalus-inducing protein